MGGKRGREDRTYAPDDGHEVHRVCFRKATRRVHFMDEERDVARSKFLDQKVGKEVIITREVLDLHDLGRAPF
jgi:hypothetical protein